MQGGLHVFRQSIWFARQTSPYAGGRGEYSQSTQSPQAVGLLALGVEPEKMGQTAIQSLHWATR
jgi:hypothetical protein